MENPFQAMTTGADNQGCLLPASRAPTQVGEVVCHNLEGIEQIIEILNLGNWTQSAQCQANALTEDCGFAYTSIGDAKDAVFILQTAKALVDITQVTNVFTKGDHAGFSG